MTYLTYRKRIGQSTKLISSRIQVQHVEFAKELAFNFNKFANKALETLIHDLQTEHVTSNTTYHLTYSGGGFVGYSEDGYGSTPKMLRIRRDLLEYLEMNKYKVNTALNLAIERWRDYYKQGNVADYVIHDLQKRGKY